jgi:hypothetical protein
MTAYVEAACKNCGKVRRMKKYRPVPELCRACSYASLKVERITLKCVGYTPYETRLFAKNCAHEREFLPRQTRIVKHKADDGRAPFVDVERGQYRCRWCAGKLRLLRANENKLRARWEATKHENFPRIRSVEDLRELQSKLTRQSDFRSEQPKRIRGKDLKKRKLRREKSPGPVRGLCGLCGTLLFSYKMSREIKFHQECFLNYQRAGKADSGIRNPDGTFNVSSCEPVEVQARRGKPVQLESLKRHFAWTVWNKLHGDTLGEIARNEGVQKNAVAEGIAFVMQHLPQPEQVPVQIRDRISALRASVAN